MMSSPPRVVILGAGFGGLFAARALANAAAEITIVDRHNYHLFQPLLYQVATAGLPPSDIAWPIRSILHRQRNTSVLLGEVVGIDVATHRVQLRNRGAVPFDYLIVATGSTHSYFGHEEWEPLAPGLKSIDDATHIRRRILKAFEAAEMEDDAARRERLLKFVIVGGGPTGVELAGTIAELAHHTLAKDFRRIDPRAAKVVLVEAGPRVLAAFKEPQSAYAQRALERLGVEVRLGTAVTGVDEHGVTLADGAHIPSATVLWAAGVAASPAGRWLGAPVDRAGRVLVKPDLSIPADPSIFVIGDAALVETEARRVPGVAPAAKQQGRYVARVIDARLRGRPAPPPFVYRDAGNLATIGRQSAVIEFPFITLRGFIAWWIWGFAHIYFLLGVPSPLVISLRWLWEYLTYGRGARLITGAEHAD
jgi:NADH dehydrogenase